MKDDRYDLITLIGLVLFSFGLGMIYLPLFFISMGVWLSVMGIMGARWDS